MARIKYKVIHDPDREARGLPCFTFTIDGQPSLMWFHRCKVHDNLPPTYEGDPELYFVNRCISRLKAGRSDALNGGKVEAFSAEIAKPTSGTKAAIEKEKVAVEAFLKRGKLGRLEEAAAMVEEQYGATGCKGFVCGKRHKALVKDDKGNEYVVSVDQSTGKLKVKKAEKKEPAKV